MKRAKICTPGFSKGDDGGNLQEQQQTASSAIVPIVGPKKSRSVRVELIFGKTRLFREIIGRASHDYPIFIKQIMQLFGKPRIGNKTIVKLRECDSTLLWKRTGKGNQPKIIVDNITLWEALLQKEMPNFQLIFPVELPESSQPTSDENERFARLTSSIESSIKKLGHILDDGKEGEVNNLPHLSLEELVEFAIREGESVASSKESYQKLGIVFTKTLTLIKEFAKEMADVVKSLNVKAVLQSNDTAASSGEMVPWAPPDVEAVVNFIVTEVEKTDHKNGCVYKVATLLQKLVFLFRQNCVTMLQSCSGPLKLSPEYL